MSVALITATVLGITGLGYVTFLGYTVASSAEVLQHTTFGIFFTLITLLSHSMTMFYLIGKGKAVREAAEEGGLSRDYYLTVANVRKPVFGVAPIVMLLTMTAAIFGGGVDTGVLPAGLHSVMGLSAIVGNLYALRVEIGAMLASSEVVAEVDRLLEEQATS
jgi:hypothetical protein